MYCSSPILDFRIHTTDVYVGSSTLTVAFQVYEILKIDPGFLQFF